MGIDHIFHAIGNQIAARQAIQHPTMPHRNAIIYGNGVELFG